jgi:hypothetical protein
MSTLTEYYADFAARTEAAVLARDHAEAYHPTRLLGIAQVSIETALGMDDLDAIKRKLAADLARITPPAVTV